MRFGLGFLLWLALLHQAWGCQPGADCAVPSGVYRVAPPAGWNGHSALPTMVYFPGYRTTAADTMADADIHDSASRLGVLLVALEPAVGRWDLPAFGPARRDEGAYVAAVIDAVERDYPVDRHRLLAAGFSVGASMLWYLACAPPSSLSGRFTAFAAFSGTFWIPQPQNCAGPPFSLIQLHGTADTVFPLHGRTVQNGRMRQGDSMEAMAMLRRHDSCQPAAHRAGSMPMLDAAAMPCEVDDSCEGGTKIRMCIHPGKHEVEGFWIEAAWSFVREIVSGPPSEPGEGLRLQNRGG